MNDGVIRAPNIWDHPEVYELENDAVDRGAVIESTMRRIHDWSHGHVVDIGCGSGYHLPRFARGAARVTGVEPHPPLVGLARARVGALRAELAERITVEQASAQALPVRRADVAHARWSYFFGPGCEPGLAELHRVLSGGGTAFVIDNDTSRSTFGSWVQRAYPAWDSVALERFWGRHGFQRVPLDISWQFADRAGFEQVVRIEFAPELAEQILADHRGCSVDYAVNLWWRHYP
ncbi:MAG: SAM-dependent methyltransferase [Micrococcales bacterium]|nr:MAG: SAM-dependent methyltransferase [Micrococcales bacterium]PIE25860.1 MAG: SAM-dependent methyltransferase [Micrococcales bacterium]